MGYENINPIQQFNFQINRVLTYGDLAGDKDEIRKETAGIRTLADWEEVWTALGERAERRHELLRAAYCFRMVEFFLKAGDGKKEEFYQKSISDFYRAFDDELHLSFERHELPFEGGLLHCIRIPAKRSRGTLVICGGYDSFIEEFVLQALELAKRGYDVCLFEGPGQGRCLRQDLFFRHDFEKPTSAVLDYFGIDTCAMVGISWGGYFALRSAAFEKRIGAAVAYDVLDDGLEVMTNVFPQPIRGILRRAYRHGREKTVNALVHRIAKRSVLADWAISQGMYITGTSTPYEFYERLSRHTLRGIGERISADVLLLAGECDHYVPLDQYRRTKDMLSNAHTLTCRLFTREEGGEQHCQIGNHMLAVDFICDWLDRYFAKTSM